MKRELNSGEAVGEQDQLRFQESRKRWLRSLTVKGEMMRKKVFMAALACGLLAVFAAAPTYAQLPGTALRATIPFDFSVRGKVLPAGDYEIKRITDAPEGLMISVVNYRHERGIFRTLPAEAETRASKAKAVFH